MSGWDLYDLLDLHMLAMWDLYDLHDLHMFCEVGSV